ncbi:hypothetical protein HOS78_gp171 [Lactobacillus phage Bacchae]|uniref:Uncharacterized protein n=1 Tax=Lactobacillus phage Bacchae TaxID=2079429 RepID=A0A2K9VCI6_9CAUD|nr:hypothetical protein HOS78_gp171 [Lactobacillus phage Bacchae]AUV59927.1 hypothetical protein [Lactobacillus phage Bacchae]
MNTIHVILNMLRKGSNIIMYDDKEGIIDGANLIHFKGLTITDSGLTATISDKGYSKITELGVGLFTKKELGKQVDINPLDDIAKGLVNTILTSNAFDNRVEHRYGNTGNLRIIFDKQLVTDLKRNLYDNNYGEDAIKSDALVEKVIESVAKRFNTDYVTVHLSDDTSNPSTFIDPRLIEPDTPQQGYLDIYYTVGEPKPKVDVEAVLATLSDRVKNLEDKGVDAKVEETTDTTAKVDVKED